MFIFFALTRKVIVKIVPQKSFIWINNCLSLSITIP